MWLDMASLDEVGNAWWANWPHLRTACRRLRQVQGELSRAWGLGQGRLQAQLACYPGGGTRCPSCCTLFCNIKRSSHLLAPGMCVTWTPSPPATQVTSAASHYCTTLTPVGCHQMEVVFACTHTTRKTAKQRCLLMWHPWVTVC